jgi:hypothetical protein
LPVIGCRLSAGLGTQELPDVGRKPSTENR